MKQIDSPQYIAQLKEAAVAYQKAEEDIERLMANMASIKKLIDDAHGNQNRIADRLRQSVGVGLPRMRVVQVTDGKALVITDRPGEDTEISIEEIVQ